MIGSKLTLTARVWMALALMTGVMLIAFVVLAWFATASSIEFGVTAAALACGVCWISGIIALFSMLMFRDPQQAVQGLFIGMMFRMGVPLLVGLALVQSQSRLLEAGVIGMTIGVYLIGLAVETVLTWWIVGTSSGATPPEAAKVS